MQNWIGISEITYYLPKTSKDLVALEKENKLESSLEQLYSLGFNHARIAENETHVDLAIKAIKKILRRNTIDPAAIDLLIYSGALPDSVTVRPTRGRNTLDIFKYTASKLQYDFGLTRASVIGVSQQGCVSFLSSIWMARNTLLAEHEMKTALCVSSDVLPKTTKREIIYNIISDAACAVILEKNATQNKIISYAQISKGYYWDPDLRKNELVASYFPTAKLAIEKALKKAKLNLSDIDWIIPHNVNMRSWDILLGLLKFPKKKFFGENIIAKGHTIAADNFINLRDATDKGFIKKGQLLLLFTFGFGAHWSCLILEH